MRHFVGLVMFWLNEFHESKSHVILMPKLIEFYHASKKKKKKKEREQHSQTIKMFSIFPAELLNIKLYTEGNYTLFLEKKNPDAIPFSTL